MSGTVQQIPFTARDPAFPSVLMPMVPIALSSPLGSVVTLGLADTGATMNVLPYSVGLRLGFVWEQLQVPIQLAGTLASVEARAVGLNCAVGAFEPVVFAFAWARSETPLLLGQVNFFMEFDVCVFRSRCITEVRRKPSS